MATASCSSVVDTAVAITNYARIGLATQNELPNILRKLLFIREPPHLLEAHLNNNSYLSRNLKAQEWNIIRTVRTNQYDEFNVPLMYKIIRNLNLVPYPTQGWDNQRPPLLTEITVGDDIERIRRLRNEIVHRGNTNMQDHELANYFSAFKDLASRLEKYLMLSNQEFVSKIENVETCSIDNNAQELYTRRLEELVRNETQLVIDAKNFHKNLAYLDLKIPGHVSKLQKVVPELKLEEMEVIPKNIEENANIPEEIKRLDRKSIEKYCQLLQGKMAKRHHFRLVVVGPKGSGKTSLVRRILQQPLDKPSKVRSTNGIDIHILKCKIQTKSGIWIFMEGVTNREVANMTLKRCLIDTATDQNTVRDVDVLDNEDKKSRNEIETSEARSRIDECEEIGLIKSKMEPEEIIYSRTKQTESKKDLAEVLNVQLDENEYATIDLWDFAGDRQFYNTHQIFLSKQALYIVTADMTKDIESILGIDGEDPNFWFQTLQYYEPDKISLCSDPPIILVGTKMDLCRENDNESTIKLINMCVQNQSFRRHIRYFSPLSNTQENNEEVFEKLRDKIFDLAKVCPSWNQEIPVRWIHLEKTLFELANEKPIVTKADVIKLGLDNLEPIQTDDEVDLFLKYHHETGDFVYFEDIPDYVVLSPQKLSNAFKCIITSDELQKFDIESWEQNDWNEIRNTGKLSNRFIDYLLNKNELSKFKIYILNIMEKYDIIVRSSSVSGEENFYVPCMVETATDDVDLLFNNKSKTSCLCFVFDFLPRTIFNHVLGACTRRYKVTKKDDKPVFFKGICLFDLDDTGCEKLLLLMNRNVIQVQVWKWNCRNQDERTKKTFEKSYSKIRKFMCDAIENVNVNRCKTNIPYKTQLKCNITLYSCLKGMKDHDQLLRMEDYYCEEHEQSHNAKQIYSDWYEDDPKVPLDDLNHMRINFTKMGIIVADILSDALYDLIRVGDPTFKAPPRNECDITELYNIHRNKIKAFKPKHGWGGKWGDLNANDIEPGDDIERIRLTRNELNHSSKYEMQDKQFYQLCNLHRKILDRFQSKNNVHDYVQRFEDILTMKVTFGDWEKCKNDFMHVCKKVKLPDSITALKGNGCTISCDIISPLPVDASISWFKDCNGKERALRVDTLNEKYRGSTIENPSLVIRNVDEADEGSYSCRISYPSKYKVKEDSETVVWPSTYLHVKDKKNLSNNMSIGQISLFFLLPITIGMICLYISKFGV